MERNDIKTSGPLVTVLMPTCNRHQFLPAALDSVIRQDYADIEIFVMNDGGEDVSDIVESFRDPRIMYYNSKENRGKAYRLNEAISKSQGKYICYLDDDDIFYPHHVSTLVNALETHPDCHAAYSDLYRVSCRVQADNTRLALSKTVEISRDFDRFFMFYFNHALHVSLMHRRDLLEKAGPYNEELNVLIDWDLTKRLIFYTDFHHVHEITGEFYAPVNKFDRISVKQRRDKSEYARNVMKIRTTRPPKPWPKVEDNSIIFICDKFDQQAGTTMGLIWRHTFYPYEIYLPIPQNDLGKIKTEMPNIVCIPVSYGSSQQQQVDVALEKCQGEYITIVPRGFPIEEMWIEDPLYALMNSDCNRQGFLLEESTDQCWAAVVRRDILKLARQQFGHLSIRDSLAQVGCNLERIKPQDISFQFDQLYYEARSHQEEGNWALAVKIYEYIAANHKNELWMKGFAASACHRAGDYKKALELSRYVNGIKPTIDMLLLEAKLLHKQNETAKAIELLERAESILEPRTIAWKKLNEATI